MDNARVQLARQLLSDFAFTEWPDLTCERAPSSRFHTSTVTLPSTSDPKQFIPFLLLSLARILGVYCNTTDILLAYQAGAGARQVIVRASWNNEQTWAELAQNIAYQLQVGPDQHFHISELRHALGLQDKQFPCLAALTLEQKTAIPSAPDFPFTIFYEAPTNALSLISYSTSLHPSVSDQFLAQLSLFLDYALNNTASTLSTLPQLPSNLLSICSKESDEKISKIYPHISRVEFATDYLRGHASSSPDAIAVRWFPGILEDKPFASSESITYSELDQKASQFARWLVVQGLQQEDRAGVCLPRDIFFHVALMGIMRAGGCYVPIDPELPPERKAYIARDSNAKFVLTATDISPIEIFGPTTVYVDDIKLRNAIEKEERSSFNVATVDGLSYMLYTSGTTGHPKGCLLTHKGLAQAILSLSSTAADVRMNDLRMGRYLAVASIAFDVHLGETFVPLALGMPLFSAPRSDLLENLPHYVNALGITHLGIVPSLIEATMNTASDVNGKTMLRYIASGGEKMSDSILDKWANHPQVRLANFYGPSEVTIGCCARYMAPSTPRANIGRPLANVSGFIVGDDMKILPRGGIGELIVEGPLVGRGYHGRPDLTEKVFLNWPDKSSRAYRTGDLVRMLPDSTIEIMGRIDTQIKLRGVRIESEGISAIVRKAVPRSVEATLDAATILAKHPAIGRDQLVSFVTWTTTSIAVRKSTCPIVRVPPKGLLQSIRTICDAELPSYMRPTHIIPLTWLPLSSNGKTDAKILHEIFKGLNIQELTNVMTEDNLKSDSVTACTEIEEVVFSILKDHTPSYTGALYPSLSVFECGLDSLGVIKFTFGLKSRFRKHLRASDIMKNPLLKDIARLVVAPPVTSQVFPSEDLVPAPAIRDVYTSYPIGNIESVLPPLPIQLGVVARSAELDSLYVQHVILKCNGDISFSKLKQAWTTVVARHPMLRTVFHIDRLMLQVVLRPENVLSVISERRSVTSEGRFVDEFGAQSATAIAQEINRSISTIPPLRLTYFSLPAANIVVLSIHHALYDGTSLPLIIAEIGNAYIGSDLLPVASMKDILGHLSSSNASHAARQFWVDCFKGFTIPKSPFNEGWRDALHKSAFVSVQFISPLSSVKSTATKQQITLQALLTCTFAKLIGTRLYHSRDVSFGVIRSGRLLPVENIDSAICPTISLLPMRVNFDQEGSLLASTQETISRMVEYENVPLSQVQTWVRPGENLFEVLFSVSVRHHLKTSLWTPINEEPPVADYPLAVEAVLDSENNTLVIRAAWMEGLLVDHFVSELLRDFEATTLDVSNLPIVPVSPSVSCDTGSKSVPQGAVSIKVSFDKTIAQNLHRVTSDFLQVDRSVLANTTSLVSIGLDSIKAVGLAKRITKLGYKVNSTDVLKAATIQKLAQAIELKASQPHDKNQLYEKVFKATLRQIRQEVDINSLKLSPDDELVVYPATALQAGMLSQTIASNGALYVNVFPFILPTGMDVERLHLVWLNAIDMFSILRTSFHFLPETGTWTQVVHSTCRLRWSLQEIKSEQDCRSHLRSLLDSLSLDDDTAFFQPPIWLWLFMPSSSSNTTSPRLVLVMHHALYDGLSISRLLRSIENLYLNKPLTAPVPFHTLLPEILYQEKEGTSFWEKHLDGFRPTTLSNMNSSEGSATYITSKHFVLDPRKLALLSGSGVTIRCLFQAGVAKLLSSLTHTDDVVFGQVVSGRGIPGSEDVVGPMLNTIPCRVKLGADTLDLELLQQIHQSNLDILPWQLASLRSIQKAIGIDHLWDWLFVFQPTEVPTEGIWTMDSGNAHEIQVQYHLHIEVEQNAMGFTLRAASRFDEFGNCSLSLLIAELGRLIPAILDSIDPTSRTIAKPISPSKPITSAPAPSNSLAVSIPNSMPPATSIVQEVIHANDGALVPPALRSILLSLGLDLDVLKLETPLASLGLDSITAIQIAGKCRLAGIRLRAADVMHAHTLGDIVTKLGGSTDQGAEEKAGTESRTLISEEEREGILSRFGENVKYIEKILPMSPGTKYFLAGWQSSKGSRWQCVFPFRIPGSAHVARLKNAWDLLIKRHEILRSVPASAPGSGEPRLVVFTPDLPRDSFSEETLDRDTFHRSLLARLRQILHNPLDIGRPPVQAILIHSQPRAHAYLAIHINHSHYDAWSFELIIRDFSALFNASEPTAVGSIERFLGRFPIEGKQRSSQEVFWKSTLPVPFRPVMFPRLYTQQNLELPKCMKRICISNGLVALRASECDRKARLLGSSLNAMCLALWASVHARYAGSSFATFGIWHAGRSGFIDDIEHLTAPCLNVLPVHVSTTGTIHDAARYIRQNLIDRTPEVEHSDLADIDRWTEADGVPLFNACVNILKVPKMSEEGYFLEPVSAPYFIPEIAVATITSTLDEVAYASTHRNDLLIECVIVEKTDSLLFAIDSDASWMNEEQTKGVLADYVAGVVEAFSD